MPISLRAQVAPTYSMPRFESGNVSAPTIAFDASQSTGFSYADGIAVSHHGAQVLHIGNTVTVDAVLVGNGAGLSNIAAANITGLTQALDVIDATSVTANVFVGDAAGISNVSASNVTGLTAALDVIEASSVSSNVFIGDGAGLSNVSAANVTGLTAALDVIDASSVTANTFVGDGAGLSNIAAANVVGDLSGNVAADDLTVTTLSSDLLPSANVTYDIGSGTQRFRDLYLSGNTIDLAGALIQALGANVFIQNLDVGAITGNGAGLTGISIPPSITYVTITDDSWNPIDDLALSTTSIGYLVIEGNNFEVGTTVSVGGTAAASVTVVNAQLLRVGVNPKSTGTYDIVVETGGGSAIKINAVSFDPFPVWSTSSSLGNVVYGNAFSITLAASEGGGSAITYSNISALPPSTTLSSNGLLAGNITASSSTTYNFSVEAIDAQLQSALRSFSLVYQNIVTGLAGQLITGTDDTTIRSLMPSGDIMSLPLTNATVYTSIGYSTIGDAYAFMAIGYFTPPTTGTYTFYTRSDDGSGVWVGSIASAASGRTSSNATVNNNLGGSQPPADAQGTISLTAGTPYAIRIVHNEGGGGDELTFSWSGPGIAKTTSLSSYFSTWREGSSYNYQNL